MRIVIVNTRHYRGGGDSTYAFNLAALLRGRGHEVSFFAMQDERNLPDPNSDLFVSPIDFRELNRKKNPVSGVRVLTRSIYSAEAGRKFAQLLERVQPDVVHLQNIHAHITPAVIFEAKKRGVPVVWTLHDHKLVCPNSHCLIDASGEICEACRGGRYVQAVLKRCKKGSLLASAMASLEAYAHRLLRVREQVDAFLCPSQFLRGRLLENGFEAARVHHLPLFIPDEMMGSQAENQGYFLFLGKLEPLKGIFPLLEAARRTPQVRIRLAGGVEEPLRSRLAELLPANVEYVGRVDGQALADLRRNAIGLLCPSLCYENQPFSILELFACGKPVIASDLGGMVELVGDDRRGWLVAPNDADALSRAMVTAVTDSDEYQKKAQAAYRYVCENHTAVRHYQSLMDIYQSVCSRE